MIAAIGGVNRETVNLHYKSYAEPLVSGWSILLTLLFSGNFVAPFQMHDQPLPEIRSLRRYAKLVPCPHSLESRQAAVEGLERMRVGLRAKRKAPL